MESKKTMSWGWIIFWIIIFWPVGIYFIFKKINSDKTATLKNSSTVAIISYILMGMGLLYVATTITEDPSMSAAAVVFLGGGIWVFIISRNMKKNGEKYKKYIDLVVNQSSTQIDNIAAAVGVSYDTAKADLQKMIDKGYFIGAFINEGVREIVLKKHVETQAEQISVEQGQTRIVSCRSCGANNAIIIGQRNDCEYCGSPLES